MSRQDALAFVKKTYDDAAFRVQLAKASAADGSAVIRAAGFHFTPEELQAVGQAASGKLADTELDAAAGGFDSEQANLSVAGFCNERHLFPGHLPTWTSLGN